MTPDSMRRAWLGTTPIGLGLAALGRPGYINLGHDGDLAGDYAIASMRERAFEVLDAAWRLGIRYFDAARSYGRAETFLNDWLTTRQIDPQAVTVGSKWGYIYTADWQVTADKHEVKDHSLANLDRQFAESTAILSPYLRLYQIHSATEDSGVLENNEVLARLGELRDRGLVMGLSLSGPRQAETLRQAMTIMVSGRPLFWAVQATWNLLAQEAGPALAKAHDAGWGVIVKESLANGRLTTRNNLPQYHTRMDKLIAIAQTHHTTVDALAIAAVLAQPWANCVLSGATTVAQLESNCGALGVPWSAELGDMLTSFAEEPHQYWATRSQMSWN